MMMIWTTIEETTTIRIRSWAQNRSFICLTSWSEGDHTQVNNYIIAQL